VGPKTASNACSPTSPLADSSGFSSAPCLGKKNSQKIIEHFVVSMLIPIDSLIGKMKIMFQTRLSGCTSQHLHHNSCALIERATVFFPV
jgi:hypothetical protein